MQRGGDRGSSEDGASTTVRIAMQVYAASSADEVKASTAFVVAAQLEAALPSIADIVEHCRINPAFSRIVVDALQYGIDTSAMDADVHDCIDALEHISSASQVGAKCDRGK